MFTFENFDIKLDTEFVGRNFIYSAEVESTNSLLLDKSNKFNTNGTVLLAEKQTKGKGRKDRVWYSNKDQNLTFSILLTDKKYFGKKFNSLVFVSSLAVALAVENLYQLRTELKWPNDVLIKAKKTAGILLESSSSGSKIDRVVVGIGLNVNQTLFQGDFNFPPTSIKNELNENIDRERLLAEILNIFEEIIEKSIKSPNEILRDWKTRCRMIGEKISVTVDDTVKYGIFDDIDNEGYLILKSRGKTEKIYNGDVSLA